MKGNLEPSGAAAVSADRGYGYEPNILSNPRDYFGIWTPDGWRTHRIVYGSTSEASLLLSGNGSRTVFPVSPLADDPPLHDVADPHGDHGIYPAEPRVEYPSGRPRWAVSHTFLAYPVADQTLYQQEYTWADSTLTTHFRKHIHLEEAVTDSLDGRTVRVQHRPISSVVTGNKAYPKCNSAVRGVWSNAQKRGPNYYSRLQVRLCHSHNAVYVLVQQSPVIQCFGIWKVLPGDEAAFDEGGQLRSAELLQSLGIPLDAPRLGAVGYSLRKAFSSFYGGEVEVVDGETVEIDQTMLQALRRSRDIPFEEHAVGFAAQGRWDHQQDIFGVPGFYGASWDFNGNGVVDADDENTLIASLGRQVRVNYYSAAYFGNDWLSTGVLLNPEMKGGEPVICSWSQGAGYDIEEGLIHLFETPGPGQPVFVEYHCDVPAEPGEGNIKLSLRHA